jgi:hypothetical protein
MEEVTTLPGCGDNRRGSQSDSQRSRCKGRTGPAPKHNRMRRRDRTWPVLNWLPGFQVAGLRVTGLPGYQVTGFPCWAIGPAQR